MDIKILSNNTPEGIDFMTKLAKMYADGFGGEIVDVAPDECRVVLSGRYEYHSEYGLHRLVRISPFDEKHRRHTSFVLVEIDGKTRDLQVCSYVLHPYTMA